MKISELKERKKELGFSNKMVSELSGVPLSTVEKIFGGATASPRYETLRQIEQALYGRASDVLSKPDDYSNVDFNDFRMAVKEPPEEYAYNAFSSSFYGLDKTLSLNGKSQGEYTIDDCLKLPDGLRMELIDGVLYDMASPSVVHQMIVAQVAIRISAILDSAEGECEVFVSPLDVQFSEENNTDLLEPDLLIACDRNKYNNDTGRILGAPDMVMEVLSPSTMAKDRILKLNKYAEQGVREYWIVDPFMQNIHVYYFGSGFELKRHSFEDVIPLHIFEGTISVNFAAISRKLRDRLGFGKEEKEDPDDDGGGTPAA